MSEGPHASSAQHTALFVFKEDNGLRRKCKGIVEWTPFEYIILLIIVANCIVLGLGFYLPEDDVHAQRLEHTEPYFFAIFVIEMILKCIAYGFVLHPGSYLRNPWNVIDFIVIVICIVAFFPLGVNISVLRGIRAIRLLRLFRLCKLLPKLCNKDM